MNNEFYEEFSKLSEKDRKEVLDLMQYKIHIDNKNFKNRVEHLGNIIEGLESDVRVLGEHIEDDCTAHEEAIKWCTEAHELAIKNKELKEELERVDDRNNDLVKICQEYEDKINKAIDYMNNTFDITSMREFFNHLDNIENMLRGE